MDSDTDSDGSHISATPPRKNTQNPKLNPSKINPNCEKTPISKHYQKPSLKSVKSQENPTSKPSNFHEKSNEIGNPTQKSSNFTLQSSISIPISKNKQNPSSKSTKSQNNPTSKPSNLQENPNEIENPPQKSSNSTLQPSFSMPIQRFTLSNPQISSTNPITFGSCSVLGPRFSKHRRVSLNFDDDSEKDPNLPSGSGSKPGFEDIEGGLKKRAKRSNLIACESKSESSFGVMPVKKPKCGGNEGNFVKLNLNGRGKKFKFKGKCKNYSSSSRRSYYRSKKRFKAKNGVENGNEFCDEEGLVLENDGKQVKGKSKVLNFDAELIKKVVLDVRNEASDDNLVALLKLTHGYDSFRDGQLEAIKMVLAGKSTMLVLPTGAGKSLCYQLPAIVFPGITLVVSPLMALMIDQLKQLPSVVNGAFLSSSQSFEEMSETLNLLKEGSIKVLFVSPERFQNEEFVSIICSCSLISLVVIDEAHCVSEWSHNFRPSYMRLRASVLCGKLKAGCILAMTATATKKTLHAVMHALEIPSTNLVQTLHLRNNFQLSVSMSGNNKMKDLVGKIKSPPFSELKSIIIYCKFQSETDMISKYLSDSNIPAMSYHSGMLAKDRSRVQALFCSNKIRVVVATVAFGMGLDKSDVGAVIHYSLPESVEEYVQEIGRAGRDGRLSYCHLLFDDNSYFKLRSLMYSDGVDEYAVNKLLCEVFKNGSGIQGEIQSLIKESASRKFDIKEEVIITILTQLELGEVQYLQLFPQMNVTCSLNFYKTSPMELAAKDPLVAGILNKSESKHGLHVFDIPTVANAIGLTATEVLKLLQNLKSIGEITYELKDPGFCFVIVHVPEDLCLLATQMTKWLSDIECCKVCKLDVMFNAVTCAVNSSEGMNDCDVVQQTSALQKIISEYFSEENLSNPPTKIKQNSPFLRADIKVFLQSNSSAKFTPRAVARVMHGIASPAFPSATWSKTHFWGRYMHVDFKVVMEAAKLELMNFVGKDGS